jgi:hypothetical protein
MYTFNSEDFLKIKNCKVTLITFQAVYDMYCYVKRNIYNSDETIYASVFVKEIS